MAEAGDYILVYFAEPVEVGFRFERRRGDWPLHITLAPWFYGAMDAPLQRALHIVAQPIAPVTVRVGGEALFGPNKDIPVNIISNPEALYELHESLLAAVQTADGVVEDSQFIGDNYMPHITQHDGNRRRHDGDEIFLDDFHLVQLDEQNMCQVVAQFSLGEHDNQERHE